MKKLKYIHTTDVHNLQNPTILVTEWLKHFSPKKVIDIWCGTWSFVKVFRDKWIETIWVDWSWVDKSQLFMDEQYFIEKDLEKEHDFDNKYDLAISLEVAEHLSKQSAENFIKTLTSCSNYIIFSAALPWQWWQNHINEQPPEYREKLFNKHWYDFYDVFRHIFWNNKKIFWRYKQNMFFVVRKWENIPSTLLEKSPRYIIHPELYDSKNISGKNIVQLTKQLIYIICHKIRNSLWI